MGTSERNKLFWMLHLLVAATCYMQTCVEGEPQAPCFFIFGDSLSESGNNNNLPTLAKYNYSPYGIDFPYGPTGRATNGRHVPDFLSEFMGLPLIPPFANVRGSDILKGVNYASGAAGILVETGTKMGADISMYAQIINHKVTVATITPRFKGAAAAKSYLNKCLYYVNIGSNDYLNNYFMPQYYASSHIFNLTQFADFLIGQYSQQLRALHGAGARKFALVSLGLLGCAPGVIAANGSNGCVEEVNRAASIFNEKLRVKVNELNSEFFGRASFTLVNATAIFSLNPDFLRFKVQNASCCQTVSSTGLCVANGTPCENRKDYVFYDAFHTTEEVNRIFAKSAYNASNPAFAQPLDINTLLSPSA
ncbi:GDSL esterase/lipase At4g18970-like [Prosopis cineraria]|uniref:GDSL esterase/lipase At4g18970-like n=1 Tax=Prosopis cineraria TaxID=364024 RepID=UPI00240F74A2|nr:GDSL esterase/lipase At4g18970-like [Prosopis cineraria]XP_054800182.1 GDSL esterase/lipase At4g18970-like [Prosopis cineraria]